MRLSSSTSSATSTRLSSGNAPSTLARVTSRTSGPPAVHSTATRPTSGAEAVSPTGSLKTNTASAPSAGTAGTSTNTVASTVAAHIQTVCFALEVTIAASHHTPRPVVTQTKERRSHPAPCGACDS